jgi:hypothetical protein
MRGFCGTIGRTALAAVAAALCLVAGVSTAHAATATVVGPEVKLWDSSMRCDASDVPDGVVQAFRDYQGRIQFITPNPNTRRFIGPDFDHLVRDCNTIVSVSANDPDPAHFDDAGWLRALYTDNGVDIYALVHMEYHGWAHPGGCPAGVTNDCRYNGITYAVSHDGGETYVAPPPPDNFVATIPYRSVPDGGRYGLFTPSNPIKKGNYWYSMALSSLEYRGQDSGVCLMRTDDLSDPSRWRAWDGGSFGIKFANPYYEAVAPEQTQACEPVSPDQILQIQRSVLYDTYINKYVVVGTSAKFDPARSENVWGFYYSTSDDLIHWSDRELLMETVTNGTYICGGEEPLAYPSFIDPNSPDRNFHIGDQNVDLYYMRAKRNALCQPYGFKEILRVPVQFSP